MATTKEIGPIGLYLAGRETELLADMYCIGPLAKYEELADPRPLKGSGIHSWLANPVVLLDHTGQIWISGELDDKRPVLLMANDRYIGGVIRAKQLTPPLVARDHRGHIESPAQPIPNGANTRIIQLPSQGYLVDLLSYVPETGDLYWRTSRGRQKAGDRAGYLGNNGSKMFWQIGINKRKYVVARIIWRIMTGDDPGDMDVVHRNGDSTNNAWANLTLCQAVTSLEVLA